MQNLIQKFLIFLFLTLLFLNIHSFNILIFLIGTNQFERNTFEFLAEQLARRHHNVITIKPILIPEEPRLVQPRLYLVREKLIKNLLPEFVNFYFLNFIYNFLTKKLSCLNNNLNRFLNV